MINMPCVWLLVYGSKATGKQQARPRRKQLHVHFSHVTTTDGESAALSPPTPTAYHQRIYPLLTSSSAAQRECFIARDTGGIGGQARHTATMINPTYLAQRTRQCTNITWKPHSRPLN